MGNAFGFGEKKMTSGRYRILEREYLDGGIKYVLEKWKNDQEGWVSVFSNADLQVIRDAKAERENNTPKSERVVE
jgi:hypothetical protein